MALMKLIINLIFIENQRFMKIIFLFAAILFSNSHQAQDILTYPTQINLIPEGIAVDSKTGIIFISSIAQRKIIKIQGGVSSDFIPAGKDGFLEGLGMKVDRKRKYLWALSNIRKGNSFTSQIHAFDLASGDRRHKFSITDSIPRLLNDL